MIVACAWKSRHPNVWTRGLAGAKETWIAQSLCSRITRCAYAIAVVSVSLVPSAWGQEPEQTQQSPFVLSRERVETSDANPFRFAGRVVTPTSRAWPRYEDALARYQTTESCLIEDARGGETLNLLAYDWRGIRGRYAHDVCLFRIWTALESPERVIAWMEEFDFTVGEVEYPPESDGAARFGRIISGYWSWEETVSRSSIAGWGIQRLLDSVIFEPTLSITATFLPNGSLDDTAMSFIRE